jgi:hypothetical protein
MQIPPEKRRLSQHESILGRNLTPYFKRNSFSTPDSKPIE